MELTYRTSRSTIKPPEFERTKTTVYLRKDIEEKQQITYPNEEPIVEQSEEPIIEQKAEPIVSTYYEYQEAKLSHEDFDIYSAELASMNAVKGVNVPDNISQIMQDGVTSSDNQLVLMEAMADLYDLIAMMLG